MSTTAVADCASWGVLESAGALHKRALERCEVPLDRSEGARSVYPRVSCKEAGRGLER